MCHLLLAMPVFALIVFWYLPLPIAVPIYAVVTGASLLFDAFLIRSMHKPALTGREELLHSTGTVLRIAPRAVWVRLHGEEWKAVCSAPVTLGDRVRVVGLNGLTLRVVRMVGGDED